ncbi:MAG TPA: phospholipase D-like domain-containing protein [Vicinamibacterales bacterium]
MTLRYHHKLVFSVLIVFGLLVAIVAIAQDQETLKIGSEYGADDPKFPAYLATLLGAAATGGNAYQVLANGDEMFQPMLDAIASARRRISFETYIYEKGTVGERFTDALERAAKRGVQVNLVVDAMGSNRIPAEWRDRLRQAGARVGAFGQPRWYTLEELNYRTHRKILVVDGVVAFTGGAGIGDHWLGHAQDKDHWRDTMVRIEGPVVRFVEGAFNENFTETVEGVVPVVDIPPVAPPNPQDSAFVIRSSPTGGSNDLKRLYLLAIGAARRTLDICTPYFIIDESSAWSLAQAARRGVRIRVLVEGDLTDAKPVKYASRDTYADLLAQGIAIYEYQPTMMHTKVMVVDGAWSMFGSANFDNRSLELNDEMNVAVSDRVLAQRFLEDFETDVTRANQLSLEEWRRRSWLERARERFWGYFGEVF